MHIFDVIIFFELRTIQQKTVKPTYLCLLDLLGARKLAEGKGFNLLCVLDLFSERCFRFFFCFFLGLYLIDYVFENLCLMFMSFVLYNVCVQTNFVDFEEF